MHSTGSSRGYTKDVVMCSYQNISISYEVKSFFLFGGVLMIMTMFITKLDM